MTSHINNLTHQVAHRYHLFQPWKSRRSLEMAARLPGCIPALRLASKLWWGNSEQAGKLEFFHVPAKISLLARPVCLTWLQLIIDIPDSAVTIRQSLFAPM